VHGRNDAQFAAKMSQEGPTEAEANLQVCEANRRGRRDRREKFLGILGDLCELCG